MATIPETFAMATRHHRAGRLAEAERMYRQVLAINPRHAGSLHFLGVMAHAAGRSDVAVDLIGRALAVDPKSAEAHVNLANVLKDQGALDPAIAHYQRALALKSEAGEIHYSIAVALQLKGALERAAGHYQRAIALRPDIAEAQLNLGTIRAEQGDLEPAIMCYRQALRLRPDYLSAQMNLGIALCRQGNLAAAAVCFERATALAPEHGLTHLNLGMALAEQGRTEAAITCYQRALALAPGDPEVHLSLGSAAAALGRFDEAVGHYQRTLALRPGYAAAHLNLGAAFRELQRLDEAVAQYALALDCDPAFAEAHHNLGILLQQLGRIAEARTQQDRALALKPHHVPARLSRCMAELPILYVDEAEIACCRAAYEDRLLQFCNGIAQTGDTGELAAAVGSNQPFYLAYQQQNDRELQAIYGATMARIMADKYPAPAAVSRRPGSRLRVGVVCGFFCWHTVWKLFLKGWLGRLDRRRFAVFGYHTGTVRDMTTTVAAGLCDHFVPGPLSSERWREAILADLPDVLIYPEIGMDAMAGWLAAQRLAPTQCVAWGHPETSGLPTMDYFLSSAAMEPSDGETHYTEHLVRLPNLSIYYEPLDRRSVPVERADFGFRSTATIFWCTQSLYKYLPQYDDIFPRIAREVGDCQFAFIRYPYGDRVTDLFHRRLERVFAGFGLDATNYCILLPVLEQQRFGAAAGLCDIALDSIGWSGGATSLESLAHDLPIVTLPGSLMRGRHTMAMLDLMGVTETIADTVGDYVARAARLARDSAWRAQVRTKMSRSKHRLYRDDACISALEDFLLDPKGGKTRRFPPLGSIAGSRLHGSQC
jgi:protein O-GlcNAc transferase